MVEDLIRHFCGVCVLLSLDLPPARFYMRPMFFDMAGAGQEERGKSTQRRRRAPRAVRADMKPSSPTMPMHRDVANVGQGGTLDTDLIAGSPGSWVDQGFWTAEERRKSITLRKLRAVRMLLHCRFSEYVADHHVRRLLVHEDDQGVVWVLNAMVSANRPMMVQLRKLRTLLHVLRVRWTHMGYRTPLTGTPKHSRGSGTLET